MAVFKRRTLTLTSGKAIRLYGNSIAISKSLEIGEGYAPNIFSGAVDPAGENSAVAIVNPYRLTVEELMELADYNIRLWMDLKDGVRRFGVDNAKIFNSDSQG